MERARILIADDDRKTRDVISIFLRHKGYDVFQAFDGEDALEKVEQHDPHLVITDFMMPRANGHEVIRRIKAARPEIVTIAYSAFANFEMTADLLKAGAFFYLEKPFELEVLEAQIERGLEHYAMQSRAFSSAPRIKNRSLFQNMIGESQRMLAVFELIEKIANSDSTVLIQGESGTGKELVAKAIHDLSRRRANPFVAVNTAAIPDELLESELFGHVRGAFTGAVANRVGRFELADGGTIFLDEIGEMQMRLQAKLLRVLQNRMLEPVGASSSRKVDLRIIAATNQNLERLVASRDFREDLYYRLSVIPIILPPLRDRREDIPLLIESFLDRFSRSGNHKVKGIEKGVVELLCCYDWPGNVRELENLIEYLVVLKGSGTITMRDVPDKYRKGKKPADSATVTLPEGGLCLNSAVAQFEDRLISQALEMSGGNKKEAAQLLNLKRTTLIEKLKKKNIAMATSD